MNRLRAKSNLWIIASALLLALAFNGSISWLAWCCFIPLFAALERIPVKRYFACGLFFGLVFSASCYYWLPGVIDHFSGDGSGLFGILFYLFAVAVLSLFFAVLFYLYGKLRRPAAAPWQQALTAAVVWVLTEYLLAYCVEGMPLLGIYAGGLLLPDLYLVQPAALGGVFLLSFVVVFLNAWAGILVAAARWTALWKPVTALAVYITAGWLMFRQAAAKDGDGQPVSVAMMCENTNAEEKWNSDNGPRMVQDLLQLNREAARLKPDIILWTESAVPWTYHPDDDFIKEVLKIGAADSITQILGINSDYDSTSVYNSAYSLLPDGRVAGRYDKRFLLSFAEKPLPFLALPFQGTDGFSARAGESALPLPTPRGRAGVLICNEALLPGPAIDLVRNKAGFLLNISNDGWFSQVPFLVQLHFNYARLRAVENRRDLAVNSNLGFSGKINASGSIESAEKSDRSFVKAVQLRVHDQYTFYTSYPYFFLYLLIILFVIFIAVKVLSSTRKSSL